MASILSSPGLSFYAVPALWWLSIAPHFIAAGISKASKDVPDFTNVSPRVWTIKVASSEKQTPDQQRILRSEGASQNGFENLAFFLGAMLAAHYAHLPIEFINKATILYVASRVAYTMLYISTTTEAVSNLRSVTFLAGVFTNFALLIRAGRAIAANRM